MSYPYTKCKLYSQRAVDYISGQRDPGAMALHILRTVVVKARSKKPASGITK